MGKYSRRHSLRILSLIPALPLLLLVAIVAAADPVLQYRVSGLDDSLRENVRAFLGDPPLSVEDRSYFLLSVESRVAESLNALGYYHPLVELELHREHPVWRLDIRVEPGERVVITRVDVRIEGDAAADPAFTALAEASPLRVGAALHHGAYEDFKNRLLSLGRERGYFAGELRRHRVAVNVDAGEAVVELYYHSGSRFRFGEVSFDEFPVEERRVEQLMAFAAGDLFDINLLQSFQAELQRTQYFGSALVQTLAPDPESLTVPIHVTLVAGDSHHYRVGLGYSTDTLQRISLTWRTPLINSRGHHQESRLEYSPVRPRFRFTYSIPLSHPLNDTLQLGARAENNEYGSIESLQLEVAARREWLVGDWVASVGVRRLWEDWDVGIDKRNNHYILPGVSIAHTSRSGDPLDPDGGFSQLYTLEAGFDQAGSDIDLQRIHAHWRTVLRLTPDQRLVGRMELGAVNFSDASRPDLAPSLSFFAGGAQSIRGYAYQSLGPSERIPLPDGSTARLVVGGDRLAIVSGEYQYYLTPEWRAAVFADAGNAFNHGNFNPVVGAGFGVHYVSPVGAVRVDLANNVSEDRRKWRVHITFGAEF